MCTLPKNHSMFPTMCFQPGQPLPAKIPLFINGTNGSSCSFIEKKNTGLYGINTGPMLSQPPKTLLQFHERIKKHNEKAVMDTRHPGEVYREPAVLIIICANAPMA